jgi:hypothetical protein
MYSLHAPETECITKGKAHKKIGSNSLFGKAGDKINVILSAAGWNLGLLIGKIRLVPDFLNQFYAFIPNFIAFIESAFPKPCFCYRF